MHAFASTDDCILQFVGSKDSDGSDVVEVYESRTIESTLFAHPNMRRLVHEMHSVWVATQQESLEGKMHGAQSMALSQQYRSVLARWGQDGDDVKAWALFEILFFSPSDSPLILDLCQWGQQSLAISSTISRSLIEEKRRTGRPIDTSPDYWKCVALSVVETSWGETATLLEEGRVDGPRERLSKALRAVKREWLRRHDKIGSWEKWLKELEKDKNEGAFDGNANVSFIVKLILGENEALSQVSSAILSSWWELVPLYALTRCPRTSIHELPSIANSCRQLSPHDEGDDVFSALLTMESHKALVHLSSSLVVAAHLTDLLQHTRQQQSTIDSTLQLRRFILREYGSSLLLHSSLWEVGADYLLAAGSEGSAALENHLCTLHLWSERVARRALRLASANEMASAMGCICATMVRGHLEGRRWGAALTWALRDFTRRSVEVTVHRILGCATGEEVALLEILEQLGEEVLRTPSLTLLFNFYRFHRAEKDENREVALKVLVGCVISPDVPSAFRDRLFDHLLDYLSNGTVALDSSSIYSLLEFVKSHSLLLGATAAAQGKLVDIRIRLCEALAYTLNPATAVHRKLIRT